MGICGISRRSGGLLIVLAVVMLAGVASRGGASSTPDALFLDPVAPGHHFDHPTYQTSPPGDTHRLFVVQQGGAIRLVLDGTLQTTPFLTVPNVLFDMNERGLFSMAFPPDYATSRLFYVYYTRTGDGAMTVDEFQRNAIDPNIADVGSRRNVIVVPHPEAANHNGGQLEFGPDGMLYMGTGDGGTGGATGQDLAELRGKIL